MATTVKDFNGVYTLRVKLPDTGYMALAVSAVAVLELDGDPFEPYRVAARRILGPALADLVDGSDWWQEVMDKIG